MLGLCLWIARLTRPRMTFSVALQGLIAAYSDADPADLASDLMVASLRLDGADDQDEDGEAFEIANA